MRVEDIWQTIKWLDNRQLVSEEDKSSLEHFVEERGLKTEIGIHKNGARLTRPVERTLSSRVASHANVKHAFSFDSFEDYLENRSLFFDNDIKFYGASHLIPKRDPEIDFVGEVKGQVFIIGEFKNNDSKKSEEDYAVFIYGIDAAISIAQCLKEKTCTILIGIGTFDAFNLFKVEVSPTPGNEELLRVAFPRMKSFGAKPNAKSKTFDFDEVLFNYTRSEEFQNVNRDLDNSNDSLVDICDKFKEENPKLFPWNAEVHSNLGHILILPSPWIQEDRKLIKRFWNETDALVNKDGTFKMGEDKPESLLHVGSEIYGGLQNMFRDGVWKSDFSLLDLKLHIHNGPLSSVSHTWLGISLFDDLFRRMWEHTTNGSLQSDDLRKYLFKTLPIQIFATFCELIENYGFIHLDLRLKNLILFQEMDTKEWTRLTMD
eukprot:TRINITY_DN729_c0_g1_i4.p1 TRINITY_DN729_c0_g1~~TRINITY_DN729_c0_g1_i4.p1  ORF type:complete len:431 (+),score=108.66 TRINITY_DN729_c0_g1_i4:169-1461(+)